MSFSDKLKSFGMTNMFIENDLDAIESKFNVYLRDDNGLVGPTTDIEDAYFPQFGEAMRKDAAHMARSYELFYCLEKTIRAQISEMLEIAAGQNWWNKETIPSHVIGEVKKRMKTERETGITPRSHEPIDYTTFGELGEIIKANWNVFASVFNNIKALESVLSTLNTLRNPIAHCSMLAEDEQLRLELSLRDWFRLAE